MTQKQKDLKDLLLKDLCGRLPYGVKVLYEENIYRISDVSISNNTITICGEKGYPIEVKIQKVKPYLLPISSMSEEQSMELFKLFVISSVDSIGANYIKINECTGITFFLDKGFNVETHLDKLIDWLNKNHFDYRGLIEKGLAIDATDKNVY